MKQRFLWIIIGCSMVGATSLLSQPQQKPLSQSTSASSVFEDIQRGISAGDIYVFVKHFAKQAYVSLRGDEGGYYSDGYFSENQLMYILQNFFGSRVIMRQFKFSTIDESETGPYATGSGNFMYRGHRELLQIYVALSKLDDRWVITQFNVY